ncbi:hypothetical protein ACFY4C_21145 [Actinomadura viridis]|uniref:hypothetical protein n=1 Tax=Actinomadura viridis TaxID=58110 RepID=UPI0036B13390
MIRHRPDNAFQPALKLREGPSRDADRISRNVPAVEPGRTGRRGADSGRIVCDDHPVGEA